MGAIFGNGKTDRALKILDMKISLIKAYLGKAAKTDCELAELVSGLTDEIHAIKEQLLLLEERDCRLERRINRIEGGRRDE